MPHKYIVGAVIAVGIVCALAFYAPLQVSYQALQAGVLSFTHDSSQNSSAKDSTSESPTILAVGDIMLGRQVESYMNEQGDDYPFQNISDVLNSVDVVLANLEGPVVKDHTQTPSLSTHFEFDTRMPTVLYNHNVKIVNLANNHTYDLGADGFFQTTQYLDDAKILHAGNPFAIKDSYVLRTTINNKKFIFVGFNFTNPSFDVDEANSFVKNLPHAQDEFLIAMVHGGDEYSLHSNAHQEVFYRDLIDDGADVVIAHHPHVVEEIEQYKNKLIFYSLGNFIFDQYFSSDVQEELAVKITFNQASTTYELLPVKSIRSQPELMDDAEKVDFLKRLASRSSTSLTQAIQQGEIDIN